MQTDQINVALIDPHPAIRKALSARVEEAVDLNIIGSYDSIRDFFEGCEECLPDVLVSELMLVGPHRLCFIEHVRIRYPHIKVVIFSNFRNQKYVTRALRKGVRAYLGKTEPTDRVLDVIRSVYQDEVNHTAGMPGTIFNQFPRNGSHT